MRRRGFTLLEILAAALLGAMLVLLTAHVFHTVLNGREHMRHTAEDLSSLSRAFEVVSRDMHSSVSVPEDAGFTFGLAAQQGTSSDTPFQLATSSAEPLLLTRAATETQLVQYTVGQDPRTGQPMLWRRTVAYPSSNTSSPFDANDAGIMPLLPGVAAVNYMFYSADQQDWIESWDGQTGLPTAVRMDLVLQDRNPKFPPRQESWTFHLPGARFVNDEAADTQAAASQSTTGTQGTTPGGTGGAGGTGGTPRGQ